MWVRGGARGRVGSRARGREIATHLHEELRVGLDGCRSLGGLERPVAVQRNDLGDDLLLLDRQREALPDGLHDPLDVRGAREQRYAILLLEQVRHHLDDNDLLDRQRELADDVGVYTRRLGESPSSSQSHNGGSSSGSIITNTASVETTRAYGWVCCARIGSTATRIQSVPVLCSSRPSLADQSRNMMDTRRRPTPTAAQAKEHASERART